MVLHYAAALFEGHIGFHGCNGARHTVIGSEFEGVLAFRHRSAGNVAVGKDSDQLFRLEVVDYRNCPAIVLNH
jgi:hypothetical protein